MFTGVVDKVCSRIFPSLVHNKRIGGKKIESQSKRLQQAAFHSPVWFLTKQKLIMMVFAHCLRLSWFPI